MTLRFRSTEFDGWLYTLFLLLITTFFFLDPFSYTPKAVVVLASWYLMIFIALRRSFRPLWPLAVLAAFLLLIQLSRYYDPSRFSFSDTVYPWGVLYAVFLCYFLAEDPAIIRGAVARYIAIFAILLVPSFFIQIGVLFNLGLPYHLIHLGGRENFYRDYFNLAIFFDHEVLDFGKFTVVRLQGMFEEPGMLGTDCAILLTVNKILFPEKRWTTVILMAAGFLSASFAFYIYAIAYAIYYFIRNRVKAVLWVVPILLVSVFLVPQDLRDAFSSLILARFEVTDEGVFRGDTGHIDYAQRYSEYLSTASTLELAIGHGSKTNQMDERAQYGTYQSVVYEGGFIGLALVVAFSGYFLVWVPFRK